MIDARRDQVYLQLFEDGRLLGAPEALSLDDAGRTLRALGRPVALAGSGGPLLAPHVPGARVIDRLLADLTDLARQVAKAEPSAAPPRPIYLRAPDARLPA